MLPHLFSKPILQVEQLWEASQSLSLYPQPLTLVICGPCDPAMSSGRLRVTVALLPQCFSMQRSRLMSENPLL